jgi:hypothetical protein
MAFHPDRFVIFTLFHVGGMFGTFTYADLVSAELLTYGKSLSWIFKK